MNPSDPLAPAVTFVAIDTGVLGLLTHPDPSRSPDAMRCLEWLQSLLARDAVILLPEIADYEERREYLRRSSARSLLKLDALGETCDYLPLSTQTMRSAAALWARLRHEGHVTADPKELDGDVILCAQIIQWVQGRGFATSDVVVATTNVGHLSWMLPAKRWEDIV